MRSSRAPRRASAPSVARAPASSSCAVSRAMRARAGRARAWLGRGRLSGEPWLLLAHGPGVTVNAEPLISGLRVLADRDEIRIGRSRLYFSAERCARVERFTGSSRPVHCPRCDAPIAAGELVVRCPGASCGLLHHHAVSISPATAGLPSPALAPDEPGTAAERDRGEEDPLAAGDAERSCWLYAETCAGCRREPTAPALAARWTPEGQ